MDRPIKLDLGCGGNKQQGFTGMDARNLPGVDIVHNIVDFPWPLADESCSIIIASHLFEHICPMVALKLFDECWRILGVGDTLAISMPYAGSRGFWQDPSHCSGFNEVTFQYLDPHFPLYGIYQPKPWKIKDGFPVYQNQGNMEVILTKMDADLAKAVKDVSGGDLGISVAEGVKSDEKVGG